MFGKGKKPRIARSILVKHKSIGGVGFPDIQDYTDVILSQLRPWFNLDNRAPWMDTEIYLIPKNNTFLFFVPVQIPHWISDRLSPLTRLSLSLWHSFCKNLPRQFPLKNVQIPLKTLELLSHSLGLNRWINWGLMYVQDLVSHNSLFLFRELAHKFNLPETEYFTYLRVKSILKTWDTHSLELPVCLFHFLFNQSPNLKNKQKGISLCYNLLGNKVMFTKSPAIVTWESVFQKQFSDEQWQSAIAFHRKAIHSSDLWIVSHKILLNWYLIPVKLN